MDSLASDEALFLVRHGRTRELGPPGPDRAPRDPDVGRVLAELDPEDRALLAQHHLAGLDPEELAREPFRPASLVRGRWPDYSARVAGPLPPGVGPDAVRTSARARLRRYADIPVLPVHAGLAARRAHAEASLERGRMVSVAVCALVGLLVALAPNLARIVNP